MIPKVIHYCWFGRNPLPRSAKRCISSWRRYMPGYEIKEWNEDNFDVNICPYVAEAYAQKKYAFVSDYARFRILHHKGGLYFDTDVEFIKPLDQLVEAGNFMGIEQSLVTNGHGGPDDKIGVAPGLGIGAEKGDPLMKEITDYYERLPRFDIADGTVVTHTTGLLFDRGLRNEDTLQHVAGFTIYPHQVLCPMDSTTGIVTIEPDTVAIHRYDCSWMDHNTLSFRLHQLKNKLIAIVGPKTVMRIADIIKGRKK